MNGRRYLALLRRTSAFERSLRSDLPLILLVL